MNRRVFLFTGAAALGAVGTSAAAAAPLARLRVSPVGTGFPADACLEADFGDVRHLVWATGGAPIDFRVPVHAAGLALTLTAAGSCIRLDQLPRGRSEVTLAPDANLVFWRA